MLASAIRYLSKKSKRFLVVLALVVVLLLATVNYVTGPELSFSAFYLLPIFFVTWFTGRRVGILISLIITALWLETERLGKVSHSHPFIPFWNAGVRFGFFLIVTCMVSHLKSALERAEELGSIVKSTDDAIIGIGPDGRIVSWNKGAERIYGYLAEEINGKRISVLAPADRPDDLQKLIEKIHQAGHIETYETTQVRKDGGRINASLTISPIKDAIGHTSGISIIARDVTKHQRMEEALRDSEAKFRAVAETATCAIFIHQGANYLYANRAAEVITGYMREELLAMNFWEIVHPDFREFVRGRGHARQRGEAVPSQYEFKILTKTGQERWVELAAGLVNFQGQTAILGTAYDISERKWAEQERAQLLVHALEAQRESETANRAKDDFLATVSHELRTPLTSILGWARLLRSGQLDETTRATALEVIDRNAKAQAQLIEDLLDLSRIITGQLRLNLRPIELAPLIEAVINTVRPAAEARAIRLESVLDPSAGTIMGDPERLQQVIGNLLSNAVKSMPKGGDVTVRLQRADAYARIIVSDQGQGISPDFLPHIFDRFRQADTASRKSEGGLGLGLAIVRNLVELHGGVVQASSPGEGQGATFTVDLPLRAAPIQGSDVALQKEESATAGSRSRILDGLRVLIADDDPDAVRFLTTALQQWGAEVRTAASTTEALDRLEGFKPDVLISDIRMPGEDGYALIRKVRTLSLEQGGRVPAIALTAYARVEDRLRSLSAGYQMHISKPVEPAKLATIVAHLTGRSI